MDDEAADPRAVVEDVPEQMRAEIFAFRALAATGLMNPVGSRSYNWTYAEDTRSEGGHWHVGFAASDCAPTETSHTCVGLSGEDPALGHAQTDTFVSVALKEGDWKVTGVVGNMLPEERELLIGFSLPDRREPSHWDFASTGIWKVDWGISAQLTPVWVGPYPTRAPGSVCEAQLVDGEARPIGRRTLFYSEAPNREFERGGWVRGMGVGPNNPDAAEDVVVKCRQLTGPGWALASEPQLQGEPGAITGISFELFWRGGRGYTSAATCEASLIDESGEVLWEGNGRLEPLWRPGELRNYPYEGSVSIHIRNVVHATELGGFHCRSV